MSHSLLRLLPFSLSLLGATCQPQQDKSLASSMKQYEGTWLNSHEENSADTFAYRPNTFAFPPARGRTGFAIKPYGRFVQYDIAPTDGVEGHPGTWTVEGDKRLRIHLSDNSQPDYVLEIVSLDNGLLRLMKH
jgi:hypothetical protein